jgi:hypothetical protein
MAVARLTMQKPVSQGWAAAGRASERLLQAGGDFSERFQQVQRGAMGGHAKVELWEISCQEGSWAARLPDAIPRLQVTLVG